MISIPLRDDAGSVGINPKYVVDVQLVPSGGSHIHLHGGRTVLVCWSVDKIVDAINEDEATKSPPLGPLVEKVEAIAIGIEGLVQIAINRG